MVPTIAEELTSIQFRNALEQLDSNFVDLLGADKMSAHEALVDLEDLMADISGVPEQSELTPEEWDARRRDFCHAAKMHLNEHWKQPSGVKSHWTPTDAV